MDEALEAAAAGADIVMLDNFVLADAVAGSQSVKAQFPHVLVEVSGVCLSPCHFV